MKTPPAAGTGGCNEPNHARSGAGTAVRRHALGLGLAADFLYTCLGDLMQLREGLTEHELDRRDALALHDRVLDGIDNFRGALEQCAHRGHGLKALRASERLVITAETVRILPSWTREGIQDLFDESGTAHAQTVR